MTPGSDLARSLEDGTINRPKEGKVNSAPAHVSLGYLYHTQAETSKRTCGCRSVQMGTCTAYENVCGQRLPKTGDSRETEVKPGEKTSRDLL